MWVSTPIFLFSSLRLLGWQYHIFTGKPEPSCKVVDLFTSIAKHFQTVRKVWHLELNGANLPPLHPAKSLSWCGLTQAFIFQIFFLPTTHTAVVSLLSSTSSENWGSDELNWEGQLFWSSFLVAKAACSGFLRNGQRSVLESLDGADNQLCGWRDKCFGGFGEAKMNVRLW